MSSVLEEVPLEISAEEIAAVLEKEQRERKKQASKEYKELGRTSALIRYGAVAFTVLVCAYIIVVLHFNYKAPKTIILTPGGNFGDTASIAFVDNAALLLLYNVLNNLTVYCTPPLTNPVMKNAYTGQSRAATNAAWEAINAYIKGDPTNYTEGCYLYGLVAAETRAGKGLGPVDMCQGYVHIGIDIFHGYFNLTMPANITQYLTLAYKLMYPLNMFWNNSIDPINMQNQVISQMFVIAQCLAGQGALCYPIIDVETLAIQFCNQYFANGFGDTNYYGTQYMPWLGFAFPGLMQRSGDNSFVPEAIKILSVQNVLNVLNDTVDIQTPVQTIYIVGDVATTTPGLPNLLASMFYNVSIVYQPPQTSIINYLISLNEIIDQYAQVSQSLLVIGRYGQDANSYNSINFIRNTYPIPAFMLFSNLLFSNDTFVATTQNLGKINLEIANIAASRAIINVIDFNTTLPNYDNLYSQEYLNEKYVANYIGYTSSSPLYVTITETMQLLDTFAIKNVAINGFDFGGHIDSLIRDMDVKDNDKGFGFINLPLTLYMDIDVANTTAFGAAGEPIIPPTSFDYRKVNPGCLPAVQNQGTCNCCWAWSTAMAMSSRFCLRGLTNGPAPLSAGHLTSCSGTSSVNGCVPNTPGVAFSFFITNGVVDNICFPSKTITCSSSQVPCMEQPCLVNCGSTYQLYKNEYVGGSPYYIINGQDAFESELSLNGPFVSCFSIPTDFFSFFQNNPKGCYSNEDASVNGGHCVYAIGYDEQNMYFRNSWGQSWGNQGDFCIKKGLQRVKKTTWFINSGWAGKSAVVTQYGKATVIPANDGRQTTILVSNNAQVNNIPQPTTPTPRPRPPPSFAPHQTPSVILITIVNVILILMMV